MRRQTFALLALVPVLAHCRPHGELAEARAAPQCAADSDCAAGQVCEGESCVLDTRCAAVACPAGASCFEGRCLDPCDGVLCGPDERCLAGRCAQLDCAGRAEGAACADDGNSCTIDTCAAGRCAHVAVADGTTCGEARVCSGGACVAGCSILGILRRPGERDPANECQLCDPGASSSSWSPVAESTACADDGNACTSDACAGGVCSHGVVANGTLCGPGQICRQGSCQAGCAIGGAFFANGTPDPTRPCRSCEPSVSTSAWTPVVAGAGCPDDGNPCSSDLCDGAGTCAHPPLPDGTACASGATCQAGSCGAGCVIGGTAYAAGLTNPENACQACLPSTSTSSWSPRPGGSACAEDGNPCTIDACDGGGGCAHTPAAGGASCPEDGNACTGDACDAAGSCSHPPRLDGSACGPGQLCSGGACSAGCFIAGVLYSAGASDPANSCQSCVPAVSTGGWTRSSGGSLCADDANPCTADVCSNNGRCTHPARADGTVCGAGEICSGGTCLSGCWISGVFQASGTPNPASNCQACRPEVSTVAWTSRVAGSACLDEGNPCTVDQCDATGACAHVPLAEGSSCGSGQVCQSGSCGSGCSIGGASYPSGAKSPANECQACLPSTSTSAWSARPAGTACADDGRACTLDSCDGAGACRHAAVAAGTACPDDGSPCTEDRCDGSGTCAHAPLADGSACGSGLICRSGGCAAGCWIGGAWYAAGATDPANTCRGCDPSSSTAAWTGAAAGTACADDGNPCTDDGCGAAASCTHPARADGSACGTGMVCRAGSCASGCWIQNTFYGAGASNPANGCLACAPATSASSWSNVAAGSACADDGNPCTSDVCASGICTHPTITGGAGCGTGCLISGTSYADGASNPSNDCLWCQASVDPVGWTARPAGAACSADANACTRDVCAGGTCAHPNAPEGTACGSGLLCHEGSCQGGCWIGGSWFFPGAVNPGNECQSCQPAASATAWTPRAAGSACVADTNPCTDDVCEAGRCSHPVSADGAGCGAGLVCRAAACVPVTSPDAGTGDAGGTVDAGTSLDGGSLADAGSTADAGGGGDAGPPPACAAPIAARTSVITIPGAAPSFRVSAAATESGGTVIAWAGSNALHLTRLGPDGARAADDIVLSGSDLLSGYDSAEAVAVSPTRLAVAAPNFSYTSFKLMLVDRASGQVVFTKQLLESYEKYYAWSRIAWNGQAFAIYFARNATHQGDALRLFEPDGTELTTGGWGWGCSHSLDVRIAYNGTRLGPICLSDCFPEKAIMFNHREARISAEPSGDCAGGSAAILGGEAAVANGFWVNYASNDGRRSHDIGLNFISNASVVSPPIWLTDSARVEESSPHLGALGAGLLAGWEAAGTRYLVELDGAGRVRCAPEVTAAVLPGGSASGDFFTYPDGSTGWAYGDNGALKLARVRPLQ